MTDRADRRVIISVASGKGGTGKTTLAVNLALALSAFHDVRLIDADVEEPNAHIFLRPDLEGSRTVELPVPEVDKDRCRFCGRCAEVCAYGAVTVIADSVLVFPELCHGCGGCTLLCPEKAVTERPRAIGVVEWGRAGEVAFVHGRLNPGEALVPPVTRAVKEFIRPGGVTIIDAPPGTACPAVAAVSGSDYCVLVTEPTPFGLNDLALAVEMVRKLGLPAGVVINRFDLGDRRVEDYCARQRLPVLGRIPFDRKLAEAYARGRTAVDDLPGWRDRFSALGREILERASNGRRPRISDVSDP